MKKILIESQYLYQYEHPEKGVTVGGTQRYAFAIADIFIELGWEVIIVTKAIRDYKEISKHGTIIAIKTPFGSKGNIKFSKAFYDLCKSQNATIACYSDMRLGFWYCFENSFALQHGISWDNPNRRIKNYFERIGYLKTIKKYKKVICVDTNYINFVRGHSKYYFNNPNCLVYIPNFADNSQFKYKYKNYKKGDPIFLLYPRRLRKMRGYDLFLDMCIELQEMGYDIKPVLAFDDFKEDELKNNYPNYSLYNIEIVHPKMEEIHSLYYRSFLSYIPTRWSEGTSLSAIESLCCGCPVIGTYVGGLGNIIIPGFNGELCQPTVESMVTITKKYLDDPTLRNQLSSNCKIMSDIFGINTWKKKVLDALSSLL